jgi:hypothetical protein
MVRSHEIHLIMLRRWNLGDLQHLQSCHRYFRPNSEKKKKKKRRKKQEEKKEPCVPCSDPFTGSALDCNRVHPILLVVVLREASLALSAALFHGHIPHITH